MTYQRASTAQKYGEQNYLSHKISGNIEPDPFYVVGDRIPSYGIINFGAMQGGSKKQFKPINEGIESDILLRSVHAFTTNATNEEIILRLFLQNTEVLEQKITNNEMPYEFAPGAIINPNLTLEIQPRYDTMQLLIYWQPIHVLSYLEV